MSFILAIDQGTSSTKTIIFNQLGEALAKGSVPLQTHYFNDVYVEQDPEAIYKNVLDSVKACLEDFTASGGDTSLIQTCGISNQRETFVVWNEKGEPLHNAVVWQCKRSAGICERLISEGFQQTVHELTGLVIDPYFSGTKLTWLQENDAAIVNAIKNGTAYFGTVDTWLLYRLTNGRSYCTDHTNASRTMFFNLQTLAWDNRLTNIFKVSGIKLPQVYPSAHHFGESTFEGLFAFPIKITALIGDSHAAAFGEGCFTSGSAKATLGTGCSILMNIGQQAKSSLHGMLTTICWSVPGRTDFALEGNIVSCGSTIEWLKNELQLFASSSETETMARSVTNSNGVYLVPAFSGLAAPHWQMNRKAAICGLSFGSSKNHIVRAALESIPYQIKDVVAAMEADTGLGLQQLMVNGGMTGNAFVLQLLADLLQKPVVSGATADVSALGAGLLAGLGAGIFPSVEHINSLLRHNKQVIPENGDAAKAGYAGWQRVLAVN